MEYCKGSTQAAPASSYMHLGCPNLTLTTATLNSGSRSVSTPGGKRKGLKFYTLKECLKVFLQSSFMLTGLRG